jgi:Tfp pilus assembly protein PilO
MPVTFLDLDTLPAEPTSLRARKKALERDLDRMLELRGPVTEVRRLVADLDRVAAELARSLRDDSRHPLREPQLCAAPAHRLTSH